VSCRQSTGLWYSLPRERVHPWTDSGHHIPTSSSTPLHEFTRSFNAYTTSLGPQHAFATLNVFIRRNGYKEISVLLCRTNLSLLKPPFNLFIVEMPAGISTDFSEAAGGTTPTQGRQSPRPSLGSRKDTILSIVELLLQQEETRERGACLSYPVFNNG
jgi:hypothetical protein